MLCKGPEFDSRRVHFYVEHDGRLVFLRFVLCVLLAQAYASHTKQRECYVANLL